jgi:hypothetical protein
MAKLFLVLTTCLLILTIECLSVLKKDFRRTTLNRTRSCFYRQHFVEEQVRKNMLMHMTSVKSEIADVVLDELIVYYQNQASKLSQLENILLEMKNVSLSSVQSRISLKDIVQRTLVQQDKLSSNLSRIESQLTNLTIMINHFTDRWQQRSQHQQRSIVTMKQSNKYETPIGKARK